MFTGIIRRFSSFDIAAATSNSRPSSPSRHDSEDQGFDAAPKNADGVNGVFTPPHRPNTPSVIFRPPPLDPVVLHGYRDDTPTSARILSNTIAEEIRIMVPERLRISEDWRLIYSLGQDGASLATLYQRCRQFEERRAGFVLAIKDGEGGIFGAYLSEYPHPAPTYFGNGECFLWRASLLPCLPPPPSDDTTNLSRATTLAPSSSTSALSTKSSDSSIIRFKAFPYSGINEYFINCETRFLSVGAGDAHYGLWLDDALERGHSSRSQTFGNEPLSDEGEKFGIIGVEVWVLGLS